MDNIRTLYKIYSDMRIVFGIIFTQYQKKKTTVIVTIYLLATVTFLACVFIFKIVQCMFKNIQLVFGESALF